MGNNVKTNATLSFFDITLQEWEFERLMGIGHLFHGVTYGVSDEETVSTYVYCYSEFRDSKLLLGLDDLSRILDMWHGEFYSRVRLAGNGTKH